MKTEPNTSFESDLWDEGVLHIAGLDEAGRGALAGPVAVGAVILPNDKTLLSSTLAGVNDSKQLTPRKRESLQEDNGGDGRGVVVPHRVGAES